MDVTVTFVGPLIEFTKQRKLRFSLPEGALYGDLLDAIDRQFGDRLPEPMWDRQQRLFKKGILVLGSGRDLDFRETPLIDGEEIKIVPVLGGG